MQKIIAKLIPQEGILGIENDSAASAILICAVVIATYAITYAAGALMRRFSANLKIQKFEREAQILSKRRMFKKLADLIPPVVFLIIIPMLFPREDIGDALFVAVGKILFLYFYIVLWIFLAGAVDAFNDLISARSHKYMRGFVQMMKLVAAMVVVIMAVSTFIDKSPVRILAGLGASAAVMMFVFKDAILGFVASVQLSANDMLQCGDWISMPKYGADGVVTDIGLTVVKVKNWDNTIANLPTYALVSDSYINWRGMYESGGRRVMRHILLDVHSIRFCGGGELEKFSKMPALKDYICESLAKGAGGENPYSLPTNAGLFRKYLEWYIENNPHTIKSMTHFVRQLQPTENGLPLELYFFTTTEWIEYEKVMSDTFDFAIASAPQFGLRIFQAESDIGDQPSPQN